MLTDVKGGGPADIAGLRDGDVMLEFDNQKIFAVDDLHRLLTVERASRVLRAKILRAGEVLDREIQPLPD